MADDDPFICPILTDIEIDSRNFTYACLDLPLWIDHLQKPDTAGTLRLAITEFRPRLLKDFHFTMNVFLNVLSSITVPIDLLFKNVKFTGYDEAMETVTTVATTHIPVYRLLFSDMSSEFMDCFITSMSSDELEGVFIHRSETPTCTIGDGFVHLDLKGMNGSDLGSFMGEWSDNIQLDDCHGLDDDTLREFAGTPRDDLFMVIKDCDNYTVAGLVEMVTVINQKGTPAKGFGHLTVQSLTITGRGPAPPTPEQTAWFEENVNSFSWHATHHIMAE